MWFLQAQIILIATSLLQGNAFPFGPINAQVPNKFDRYFTKITTTSKLLSTVIDQSNRVDTIVDVQNRLHDLIEPTNRGRNITPSQRKEINTLLSFIEQQCSLTAPARSPLVEGTWTVQYTDAPPPSNGKLGIFEGIAQQQVSGLTKDEGKFYKNILRVPPNDWLVANLDAIWEEWDGVILKDSDPGSWKTPGIEVEINDVTSSNFENKDSESIKDNFLSKLGSIFSPTITKTNISPDYGASNWLVTFQSLKIKLFGSTLFEKKFDGTQRVWRTTYIDEQTRIVRAGRTGRREDELVFYMTRAKRM